MPKAIAEVAQRLGVAREHVLPWGPDQAKIFLEAIRQPPRGRLVLVSAITPTRFGEGKTTVSVGLAMALERLGRRAALCLREPSLGPVFGIKGGGTGGGKASLHPADRINLHFTGDLHAVSSAHNLIAALCDAALHFERDLGGARLDPEAMSWTRVVDMNDRALRRVRVGLGAPVNGPPHDARFEITAASELMAVLALATDHADLKTRIGRMVLGETADGDPITVSHLGVVDAAAALLRDALMPNLAQTLEGGPALVHAGPFANIAHGCSSVVATRMALGLTDHVITEAGFDFSLGAEKFLNIKCRQAGLWPRAVVLVATVRALMAHGQGQDDPLQAGFENLRRHLATATSLGLPVVVAINVFDSDTPEQLAQLEALLDAQGVAHAPCLAFARGGQGAEPLAKTLLELLDNGATTAPAHPYGLEEPYAEKVRKVARRYHGASDVAFNDSSSATLERLDASHPGLGVCIAKTPLSFSDDPDAGGLVRDFVPRVTGATLQAGSGFVVARMGTVQTMPGLGRDPAALHMHFDAQTTAIRGLMQEDE